MAKSKKKKPVCTWRVNVDMKWSNDYVVKARTIGEAKKKAFAKFASRPPRKCFDLDADKED